MTDAIDSVVAQIDPDLAPPSIIRRDAVLVAGPWLAGTSSVVAALRDRLPECSVLEADELAAGEAPVAVVFVVSATAPLTESDCALLDVVAADTDAVIGVVSKIDVHRTWREVLDADRALLTERAARYGDVVWVGAAAAPDLGPPVVDDLVATLTARSPMRRWIDEIGCGRGKIDYLPCVEDWIVTSRCRPGSPAGRAARAARRGAAPVSAGQVGADHRRAQPDSAGPRPVVLLRARPLCVGADRAAGRRGDDDPTPARRLHRRGAAPGRRGERRGAGGRPRGTWPTSASSWDWRSSPPPSRARWSRWALRRCGHAVWRPG